MYILSPKVNFLGGALVSASHLGQLFPGKLLTWKSESEFLKTNGVEHKAISSYEEFKELTKTGKYDIFTDLLNPKMIWCNDTCVDGGYFDEYLEANKELWKFLSNFSVIYLVNHQPINRCHRYLIQMLSYFNLVKKPIKVIILNYRACWNTEWDNELKVAFSNVEVHTLPYHYYITNLPMHIDSDLIGRKRSTMIGRMNSKCKIQCKFDEFRSNQVDVDQLQPDPKVSNRDFMKQLSEYQYVLTGYYYGGEGNVEEDVRYNHLEWSFMDTLLAGSIPITSTLFSKELERLGIDVPLVDYRLENLDNVISILKSDKIYLDKTKLDNYRVKLLIELAKGNAIIHGLMIQDEVFERFNQA